MGLLRAFIAVEIPHEIQQAIHSQAVSVLRKTTDSLVRWVSPENMHLTLKFLGDVSPTNVDLLTRMLSAEADSAHCFDLQIGGLGSFPSLRKPRVLYIGIQAPAGLEALQRGVEAASRRLGYESEDRGFSPHLTIGRVRQDASTTDQQKIRQALEKIRIDSLGMARVDSVHLFKSDLRPTGSVYTKLFSAPFKQIGG